MNLPRIPNPWGGRTVPAQDEKSYNDLYFVRFTADFSQPGSYLRLFSCDYSYDAKERDPIAPEREVQVSDLWSYAETRPLVAQWLGAGIAIGTLVMQEQKLLADIANAQSSVVLLGAAIAVLQNSLDVAIANNDEATVESVQAEMAARNAELAAAQEQIPVLTGLLNSVVAMFSQV
jgi:hypothetical protein